MLVNMNSSSSFDTIVATAIGLYFDVSDIFLFLFLHMGTIVVFKRNWVQNHEQCTY